MRILVVDDEKIKRVTLADDLSGQGHEVVTAGDGQAALELLDRELFDVLITDIKMPRMDGIELLKRVKDGASSELEVILMTAYGSIPVAVEAMKLGAFDFITKPFRNEEILPLIKRIERSRQDIEPEDSPSEVSPSEDIDRLVIGSSAGMQQVKRMVRISACTDANVLLCGETGCGKDLLADVIHRRSHRNKFPFVKVGCTLFPSTLIESELYGHEEGSFTGADRGRKGRFELAEGGTIYLDDVDDIPLENQAKLLRAIEEKVYERVGGTRPIKANVRIVASTKLNLLDKIAGGTFRQDLYYRLDVLRIRIPPLRERRGDIPALVQHLLKRMTGDKPCISDRTISHSSGTIAATNGSGPSAPVRQHRLDAASPPYEIDAQAVVMLAAHDWPGNVRELYHTLERSLLVGGGRISAELLQAEIGGVGEFGGESSAAKPLIPSLNGGFKAAMDHAEKQLLMSALEASAGNKTVAANSLSMKLSTFRDKLNKHDIK